MAKGRRTDDDRNAFWASIVSLMPRDIADKRMIASAMRLLKVGTCILCGWLPSSPPRCIMRCLLTGPPVVLSLSKCMCHVSPRFLVPSSSVRQQSEAS